jgi:hypothetical protein
LHLSIAVGIRSLGQGKVIISILDIIDQLYYPDTSSEVARKLFCNFLHYASTFPK